MGRDLEELVLRASTLTLYPEELVERCIEIARTKKPSPAVDLALRAAALHGLDRIHQAEVARATRWLAVIKRDYGEEVFEKAVRLLEFESRAHA